MKLHNRLLHWFTGWFGSGRGVWQTTYFTIGIVVAECFNRQLDPHAFILMAALTVYSAITQPALAHAGNQNHALLVQVLAQLETALSDEYVVDTKTYELCERIAETLKGAVK